MKRYTMFLNWKNHVVKMIVLHKEIYRFSAPLLNCKWYFSTELEQITSGSVWKHSKPLRAKKSWEGSYGPGEINLPNFRLYYKATVIMTAWYWHQKEI